MIIPDVNLLLYAQFSTFPEHRRARRWWEGLLNGNVEVGIAGPALFGFLRLATNQRIFTTPLAIDEAIAEIRRWLGRPLARYVIPGPRHLEIAFGLLEAAGAAGNLTTDAQLAALAIENQAELHSNDSDFARFAALKWVNPLG